MCPFQMAPCPFENLGRTLHTCVSPFSNSWICHCFRTQVNRTVQWFHTPEHTHTHVIRTLQLVRTCTKVIGMLYECPSAASMLIFLPLCSQCHNSQTTVFSSPEHDYRTIHYGAFPASPIDCATYLIFMALASRSRAAQLEL